MKIKDFLKSPKQWTKKAYARDKKGNSIGVHDKNAICWCLKSKESFKDVLRAAVKE